jgi:hypothetical protein
MIEAMGNQHHAVSLFNLVDHKKTMVFSWSPTPEQRFSFWRKSQGGGKWERFPPEINQPGFIPP